MRIEEVGLLLKMIHFLNLSPEEFARVLDGDDRVLLRDGAIHCIIPASLSIPAGCEELVFVPTLEMLPKLIMSDRVVSCATQSFVKALFKVRKEGACDFKKMRETAVSLLLESGKLGRFLPWNDKQFFRTVLHVCNDPNLRRKLVSLLIEKPESADAELALMLQLFGSAVSFDSAVAQDVMAQFMVMASSKQCDQFIKPLDKSGEQKNLERLAKIFFKRTISARSRNYTVPIYLQLCGKLRQGLVVEKVDRVALVGLLERDYKRALSPLEKYLLHRMLLMQFNFAGGAELIAQEKIVDAYTAEASDADLCNAITKAIEFGDLGAVAQFLKCRSVMNALEQEASGDLAMISPLHKAVSLSDLGAVKLLLDQAPGIIDALKVVNAGGILALHQAIINDDAAMLSFLLDLRYEDGRAACDMSELQDQKSCFSCAFQCEDSKCLQLLLEHEDCIEALHRLGSNHLSAISEEGVDGKTLLEWLELKFSGRAFSLSQCQRCLALFKDARIAQPNWLVKATLAHLNSEDIEVGAPLAAAVAILNAGRLRVGDRYVDGVDYLFELCVDKSADLRVRNGLILKSVCQLPELLSYKLGAEHMMSSDFDRAIAWLKCVVHSEDAAVIARRNAFAVNLVRRLADGEFLVRMTAEQFVEVAKIFQGTLKIAIPAALLQAGFRHFLSGVYDRNDDVFEAFMTALLGEERSQCQLCCSEVVDHVRHMPASIFMSQLGRHSHAIMRVVEYILQSRASNNMIRVLLDCVIQSRSPGIAAFDWLRKKVDGVALLQQIIDNVSRIDETHLVEKLAYFVRLLVVSQLPLSPYVRNLCFKHMTDATLYFILRRACEVGNDAVIEQLLAEDMFYKHFDINKSYIDVDKTYYSDTPLEVAVTYKKLNDESLRCIIRQTDKPELAVQAAIQGKHVVAVRLLVRQVRVLRSLLESSKRLFLYVKLAIDVSSPEILSELMRAIDIEGIKLPKERCLSLMKRALKVGNVHNLALLLAHSGFKKGVLNGEVEGGVPAVIYAYERAKKADDFSCLALLLQKGASLDIPRKDGLCLREIMQEDDVIDEKRLSVIVVAPESTLSALQKQCCHIKQVIVAILQQQVTDDDRWTRHAPAVRKAIDEAVCAIYNAGGETAEFSKALPEIQRVLSDLHASSHYWPKQGLSASAGERSYLRSTTVRRLQALKLNGRSLDLLRGAALTGRARMMMRLGSVFGGGGGGGGGGADVYALASAPTLAELNVPSKGANDPYAGATAPTLDKL